MNHLLICTDADATKVFKTGLKKLEELLSRPDIVKPSQRAILGVLDYIRNNRAPSANTFGTDYYDFDISLTHIMLQ